MKGVCSESRSALPKNTVPLWKAKPYDQGKMRNVDVLSDQLNGTYGLC